MPRTLEEITRDCIRYADEKTKKNECSWNCQFKPTDEEVYDLKAVFKCGHLACAYCRQEHIECWNSNFCKACECKNKK